MLVLAWLTVENADYLRGRRLIDRPDIRSVRSLLDYTYVVLIDGSLGMASLLEVKAAIDDRIRKAVPMRESWGVDADVVDEIPSAVDVEADPGQSARWEAEKARRAASSG